MLTPDQIQFLETNKHYWDLYKKDGVIKHYDNQLRKQLFEIARTFNTKANFCLHCNDNAANMLKYVYTQYENMEKENVENNSEEGVMKMTFPKLGMNVDGRPEMIDLVEAKSTDIIDLKDNVIQPGKPRKHKNNRHDRIK